MLGDEFLFTIDYCEIYNIVKFNIVIHRHDNTYCNIAQPYLGAPLLFYYYYQLYQLGTGGCLQKAQPVQSVNPSWLSQMALQYSKSIR